MPLLSQYAVLALRGKTLELTCPLLLWRTAPSTPVAHDPVRWKTQAPVRHARPSQMEPVVLEIKKGDREGNAFAMGVTLGRVDSNDLCLDDESVSRFHAYFQQTKLRGKEGWNLVDAESLNGSYVESLRLEANQPQRVRSGQRLRFGDVEVEFYEPEGFLRLLAEMRA